MNDLEKAVDVLIRTIEGTKIAQVNMDNSELQSGFLSLAIRVGRKNGTNFVSDPSVEPFWTKEMLYEAHIGARTSNGLYSLRTVKEFVPSGDTMKYQWVVLVMFADENAAAALTALAESFRAEKYLTPTRVEEIPMLGAKRGRNLPNDMGGGASPMFNKTPFNPKKARG